MRGAMFTFTPPTQTISIGRAAFRKVLGDIRDQLLRHEINGGSKKLKMDVVCDKNRCGTAACIGGWASIFMVGFEGGVSNVLEKVIVDNLFTKLRQTHGRRVNDLFYEFSATENYNEPNVAATAIQRYLDGERTIWPEGKMPNVLRYKRGRK